MADINDLDKSRPMYGRSGDDPEPVNRKLAWSRMQINWVLVVLVLVGSAAATQLYLWEKQGSAARSALLSTIAPGTVFNGCNEVRARGLAPLRRGEPGYGTHMDGDGDGLACEPLPIGEAIFGSEEEF
jgi:hypothetical protein